METFSKVIGLLVTVATFCWGVYTYTENLDKERKIFTFKNYHNIIADIYDGGRKNFQGSQRALIYELANFPEYKNFTCRELPRMKESYSKAKGSRTKEERIAFNASVIDEIGIVSKNLQCTQ